MNNALSNWWKLNPGIIGVSIDIARANATLVNREIDGNQKKWQEILARRNKKNVVVLKRP